MPPKHRAGDCLIERYRLFRRFLDGPANFTAFVYWALFLPLFLVDSMNHLAMNCAASSGDDLPR